MSDSYQPHSSNAKPLPWLRQAVQNCIGLGLDCTGLTRLLHRWQVAANSPFIRVINYHDTPPSEAAMFERQLLLYKQRFAPVGRKELLDLQAGRWSHDRPGVIVTFDDGLKSHADVAAPLLEKHGFTGWFFIPVGFIDTPRDAQRDFGRRQRISWSQRPGDDLGAMTWDDVRRLDQRHVIGGHTQSHVRLSASLSPAQIDDEIRQSKLRLEAQVGHEIDVFCWVGGEEWSYSAAAARAIRDAGYRLAFMNAKSIVRPGTNLLQLHRVCIESNQPMWFARYVLSGFLDAYYAGQRQRVNALTDV